jgi:hypothetical protein
MMHLRAMLLFLVVMLPVSCFAQGSDIILSPKDTDKAEIDIRALFKGSPLVLSEHYYVNEHGDTLYIDAFRFYISNISFIGRRNALLTNNHLFDAADTNTYSFLVKNIPPGIYDSMQFTIGVDSIANVSGANEGDLDPVKGMYWAWNSGYIMAKLEGHSKVCKTLHHGFEFHIGGYMPPYNTARTVKLKIPEYFEVGRSLPAISLTADAAKWFSGNLDLAKTNNIAIPGKDAAMMADNYARMLFIESIFFVPLTPR